MVLSVVLSETTTPTNLIFCFVAKMGDREGHVCEVVWGENAVGQEKGF